jgi:hypothetical protein
MRKATMRTSDWISIVELAARESANEQLRSVPGESKTAVQ